MTPSFRCWVAVALLAVLCSARSTMKEVSTKVSDVYDECSSSYGCFGQPAGCEDDKSCNVLVTYAKKGSDGFSISLVSKDEDRFAAVGFSADGTMGDDGVIFCSNVAGSPPALYYGYNTNHSSEYKTDQNPAGVSDVVTSEEDGSFMCSFTQAASLVIPGYDAIDLSQKHFLLVATGPAGSAPPQPQYHDKTKLASAMAVDLSDVSTPAAKPARSSSPMKEVSTKVSDVYDECSSSYGCFGQPAGCEDDKSCNVLVTYAKKGSDGFSISLVSKDEDRFAAVGFSADGTMGDDGVIFCSNVAGSPPALYYGYNTNHSSEYKTDQNPAGVSDVVTSEEDGSFMCSFTQAASLVIPGYDAIDLSQKHFLLVATGPAGSAPPQPQYHDKTKLASAMAVDLSDVSTPAGKQLK